MNTIEQLDIALNEYFHHLWVADKGVAQGDKAFFGILMYMPRIRGQLFISHLSLKGWHKLKPPISYPPMSWPICVLVACQMVKFGYWHFGIGVLLSFACYFRVNELCGLVRGDIADVGDLRIGPVLSHMAVRLSRTKTGNNKWVTVRCPVITALVRSILPNIPANGKVFPFTADRFRHILKLVCSSLGLAHIGYVPHSLRHGGATHDHLMGMSLEDVLMRGRWKSTNSARIYIQSGRSLLLTLSVPSQLLKFAAILSQDVYSAMAISRTTFTVL